jgi:coenzyme F420 hydrogenase subunit beta
MTDREIARGRERTKTFRDLQKEVVDRGLCCACGGCVSFCSADRLNALEMGEDGVPRYADADKCLECGLCYLICPVTQDLEAEVRDGLDCRPPIGARQAIASARATDEAILEVATDGGVVTALLLYMLDRRLIQGAIVSRRTSVFSREPMIATTREELLSAAGSQFAGTSHLEEWGERYTTYSAGLPEIKGLGTMQYPFHVALVGTPCQVEAVRKMQCLRVLPSDLVSYTIGLFCTENFAYDARGRQRLEAKLGIRFEDIMKLNIKKDLIVTLHSGTTLHVPFEEIDEVARPACLACMEFANDYADISVGGLGSPHGYTTTLIRTERGRQIYADALRRGYIEEREFSDPAELRRERARLWDEVVAFAQWKRARGEARLEELER